jgi:hypothetical protein
MGNLASFDFDFFFFFFSFFFLFFFYFLLFLLFFSFFFFIFPRLPIGHSLPKLHPFSSSSSSSFFFSYLASASHKLFRNAGYAAHTSFLAEPGNGTDASGRWTDAVEGVGGGGRGEMGCCWRELPENGGSLVNGDGGLQKRGRRPEGLCRVVLERMARIGCGTTEAAAG